MNDQVEDNLLPNEGSTYYKPEQPEERKEEESAERAKVIGGMPLIDDIIAHLDERIAFYDSIESITSDVKTKPEEHLRTVLANDMTKRSLIQEKEHWTGLKDTYAKG